ncbi:MAG: phosphoadenosine phosphosulfate reductase domain-containing protein [Candidatus Hodarchaeales archaeon]
MITVKIPYLGKIRFYWCDSCHVPLIREKCNLCKKTGRKVTLTPPGDVRPAFDGDIKRMISAIKKQFGKSSSQKFQNLIKDQVIFLNKVPYIDRMDEIIIQGEVVGVFRFNLINEDFEILPRVPLAKKLWEVHSSGWISVDIGAREPILNGAAVLSPGVLFADLNFKINDPVIVVCENEVIAVGLAKMKGDQMGSPRKGVAIKTKYRKNHSSTNPLKSIKMNWDQIIQANLESINHKEKNAVNFIEQVAEDFDQQIVAYSGGKDSLVTLDLVAKSNVDFEIIFADTGLEYPETLKNISEVGKNYQKEVIIHENTSWDFWKRFDQFGPPSRNSRWCCKSAKLFPINEILNFISPSDKQVLSFIGKRRYESLGRSREPQVSKNPWVPKQVSASPINNWNAFEVFLYIQRHKLNDFLNPLYELGFIRIGCWVCPASSMSDFEIMKVKHFSLIKTLIGKLSHIQEKYGLQEQYISWGLWRWKYLPKKIINLLKEENIHYFDLNQILYNRTGLRFRKTSSLSPCINGGYSLLLSANQMLDLSRITRLLSILGPIQYNPSLDILSVILENNSNVNVDIFSDGSMILKINDKILMEDQISSLVRTLYRIMNCDGCGICTFQCSENALVVELGIVKVFSEKCKHCLVCNDFCPLIKYTSDDFFFSPS